MKKILFVALAAVGMAACVQNEELAVSKDGSAIKFDNVFVDNATKAAIDGSYTSAKGNLDHFNVWATISNTNGTANIFENEAVTKNNAGVWSYAVEHTQHWIPGNNYLFVGVVDGEVEVDANACNMPLTIATKLEDQLDVLYATHSRSYNASDIVTPVHFDFQHLLAKVKFTAKNVITTEFSGYTYTVESINITNADNEAVYSIADGTWTASSTYNAAFGAVTTTNDANAEPSHLGYNTQAESNYERLVLPQAEKNLNIEVKYTLHKGDWYQVYEKTLLAEDLKIESGKAYNFILALGNPGDAIEFTADVTDWVEENAPVYADVTEVATAEQFETAFAHQDVNTIILGEDVVLGASATRSAVDPTLVLNNGKSITIDLNGHKLSATSSQNGNREMFLVKGNLTIKNGTIEYQHVGENMGWNSMTTIFDVTAGGVVSLDGVTAKNLGGSDMGFVAHLNNWGEVTLNVENSTLESNYVAVRVFNSGNDMNNVTIKNSALKGGNYAFWVHNYTAADFGSEAKYEAHKALLNLDVFNASNTFVGKNNTPIRLGMTNSLYFGLVSTEAELKEILAAGSSVILAEDIVLAEALKVASEKNSVIDLNGHTLSGVDNGTASYGLITNQGNLNVVGPGKLQLTATVNRGWNAYSSVISNTVGGNLVVEGGVVIEHLGGTDMAYGIDNLTNGKGTSAIVTVKDATVKSPYRAVRQFLNGVEATNELNVEAGAVLEGANKSIWMQDPSKNANTGKLVVAEGAQLKGDVYLYVCAGSTEWPVEVSIASAALVGESTVLTGNVPAGYVVVEENGAWVVASGTVASTNEELAEVIENDATIILAEGTYVLPTKAQGKELTFIGAGDPANTVIATNTSGSYEGCNYALDGSTVVFKNISITTDNKTYTGYARCKATFENCIINNCLTLYDSCSFVGCTLNVSGDQYNIWTWGAPVATFENCVFNSDGKAMLLYGQANTHLTINNCIFNDSGVLPDLKAAIEIGNDYNTNYNLVVNNTVVNGYEINDKGINTGTTLWGNKNSMPQDKLNVVVDGVDVY